MFVFVLFCFASSSELGGSCFRSVCAKSLPEVLMYHQSGPVAPEGGWIENNPLISHQ